MFDYKYLEPQDFDKEPLLPYKEMVLFSQEFIKPYAQEKAWLYLRLENTEEGDTEHEGDDDDRNGEEIAQRIYRTHLGCR